MLGAKALLLTTALSLGVTGGTVYRYLDDTGRLQARNERLESSALRTAIRDAAIGRPLPPLRLRDLEGADHRLGAPGRPHAIWIVDTERCPNCLEDAPAWNRLAARTPGLKTTLVLVGMDDRQATNAVRLKRIRTDVLVDPGFKMGGVIPLSLPSVYVLLDEEGVVTMADARSANLSCSWSFPGQLASVVGASASTWIRP